jgi:hypothetical protein
MKIIRIPKTPANAFDKHREVSDLVRNQVRHAHRELANWVASVDPERFKTEQEAADFIRIVTRILHPEGARTSVLPGSPAPKSGVWLTDPIASPKRAQPATQTRKRSRPRTQTGKRPRTQTQARTKTRERKRAQARKRTRTR